MTASLVAVAAFAAGIDTKVEIGTSNVATSIETRRFDILIRHDVLA